MPAAANHGILVREVVRQLTSFDSLGIVIMEHYVGRLPADDSIVTISVENGVISAVEAAGEPGASREANKSGCGGESHGVPCVSPSFVDLQVNGYRGRDYSSPELGEDDIRDVVQIMAESGVTQHLPTIITNARELISRNLAVVARAVEESEELGRAIPGIHVEGPFISPDEGSRGAHDPKHVRNPSGEEYREWQEASGGRVKVVTLAPERPGAMDLISEMREDGVVVAIGHTSASPEIIREAVAAGATMCTHLGNGTAAMLPRHENTIWSQLSEDGLSASIIADGYHLPPAVLKSIFRVKGGDRLVLVSDVSMPAGLSVGRHEWGDMAVEVHEDGHIGLAGTEYLAGAGHRLDTCVARMVADTDASLDAALALCTVNPARLLGLPAPRLKAGHPANFVLFDYEPGSDGIKVRRTVSAGRTVFESAAAQN